ncbi:MAG: peptidase dimerization domain-containing protein [Spirochaetales bacterium]|nr:peptidase dimerization domain-containing protein [Spirochaetales bacterium]
MYKKNPERNIFFNVALNILGKGGHSSVPYLTDNPILPGFRLIQIINEKLLYEFSSFQNVAFFPYYFDAGSTQNIIPDNAVLKFQGECTNIEDKQQLLEIFTLTVKALENIYHFKTRIVYEK